MSEAARLDWEYTGKEWYCPSLQFNGTYTISIGSDGLFTVKMQKYKGNSSTLEFLKTETRIATFAEAEASCITQENIEKIFKLSDRVNPTGKTADRTHPAGNASTFGPVPASQERVESALDEDIRLGMTISRIRYIHSQIGPAFKAIGDFLNSLK